MKGKRLACLVLAALGLVVGLALFVQYGKRPEASEPVAVQTPTPEETLLAEAEKRRDEARRIPPSLTPAPDVVEVLEPIVIESPVAEVRTGMEESELPRLGLPIPMPTQSLPDRMPLADEVTPCSTTPCCSCVLTGWIDMLQSAFACHTTARMGATLLPPSGEEEASHIEFNLIHSIRDQVQPQHCPYPGSQCLPNHYHPLEIPSVQRMMPPAK